jgi:hypothetical protein
MLLSRVAELGGVVVMAAMTPSHQEATPTMARGRYTGMGLIPHFRSRFYTLSAVLRIHDILVRIRESMPLTNGLGSESCYFRH